MNPTIKQTMGSYTNLNRVLLTALLMLAAMSGADAAGPIEDASAAYERGDYTTALRLLRPQADRGVAEAQYELGFMYYGGLGVPQSYVDAVKWYHIAADHGVVQAQHEIGRAS